MKNLKYIILILTVLIIILILSLLLIRHTNTAEELDKQQAEYLDALNNPGYSIVGLKPKMTQLDNVFFSINACIQKIISYMKSNNNVAIYSIMNKEYIENNSITEENVKDKLGIKDITKCKAKKVYELVGVNYGSYYIEGITADSNIYFNINWDTENASFDFKIISKEEFEGYINTTIEEESVKNTEKSIEKNQYNSIPYKYFTEEDVVEAYFYDYIDNTMNFRIEAYNSLEENYRNKRFGSLENFIGYVENNSRIKDIYTSKNTDISDYSNYMEYLVSRKDVGMEKYEIEKKDGYKQYTCIDSYGNYYIFKATAPMQYTLILDTYTVDIPEFVNKYNKSNDQEKALLNLNKFMLAMNDKDYKYVYSILADSFKAKNFPTYQSFETYAKQTFFEQNKFEYKKFGNEAGTYYTYEVGISDASGTASNTITKTFIMLLGEGTDFQLSFNI